MRRRCGPGLNRAGDADKGYDDGHNAECRDCLFCKRPS